MSGVAHQHRILLHHFRNRRLLDDVKGTMRRIRIFSSVAFHHDCEHELPHMAITRSNQHQPHTQRHQSSWLSHRQSRRASRRRTPSWRSIRISPNMVRNFCCRGSGPACDGFFGRFFLCLARELLGRIPLGGAGLTPKRPLPNRNTLA